MTFTKTAAAALIASAFPFAAFAQSPHAGNAPAATPSMYDRNVYQQQRIEQGLKDGSLTVQEAANLERGQSRIERMESRALADGKLTDAEKARIAEAQNRQSAAIDRERNDNQRGNPHSASSQRMQHDVQHNVNEQSRIAQGVQSGRITNREASRLERGESRINRMEAHAGRDGHIDRHEQRGIARAEGHQSRAIYRESHDRQTRFGAGQSSHAANGWQHASPQGREHGNWDHDGNRGGQNTGGPSRGAAGHNGNHYGWGNHGSTGSTAGAGATSTPATTPAAGGNRFGQGNRSAMVAQASRNNTGGARGSHR